MFTEYTVDVHGVGKVDVVRQDDGLDNDQVAQYFWDLFHEDGSCLNEGVPFWSRPTKKEVLTFLKDRA